MVRERNSNSIVYILILIVLIWYSGFGYVGFSSYISIFNLFCYGASVFMFLSSFKEISWTKYKLPTLILISTCISMLMSMLLWKQDMFDIMKSFKPYFLVLVFFFLCSKKSDPQKIELALIVIAILYVLCWLYQIYKVPELIFGMNKDEEFGSVESRGFYRFWIPTKENMPILTLFFYEMYRRTKKILCLVLMALCFVIVILHVARQMIFWTFVALVLLLLYHNRKKWKNILVASVLVYFSVNILIDNVPTLQLLFEQTETQAESAENDIRAKAMDFYLKKSQENPIGFLFGNGVASSGPLGTFNQKAQKNGYYESDIGYVALLFDFGLLGLISYILLFFQILRMKVEDKYIYLKFYLFYIYGSYALAHSLTTNILFNMCTIYVLYCSHNKVETNRKKIPCIQLDSK